MNFTPKTEQEIQSRGLIDAGSYPFEVIEACDKQSKSGNDMIELKLKIWDHLGRERQCFDYLLEIMDFKLRHFCDAVGILDKYESGNVQAIHCIGRSGTLELIIQQGKQKPEGGYYPDKNSVKDYIKKENNSASTELELNDELPF